MILIHRFALGETYFVLLDCAARLPVRYNSFELLKRISFLARNRMHVPRSTNRQFQISIFIILGLGLTTTIWALPSAAQEKPPTESKKDDQPKKSKPPVREEQEE